MNAVSITKAQPVYLRALGEALLAAEDRYGNRRVADLDFEALLEEAKSSTQQQSKPATEHPREEEVSALAPLNVENPHLGAGR